MFTFPYTRYFYQFPHFSPVNVDLAKPKITQTVLAEQVYVTKNLLKDGWNLFPNFMGYGK